MVGGRGGVGTRLNAVIAAVERTHAVSQKSDVTQHIFSVRTFNPPDTLQNSLL